MGLFELKTYKKIKFIIAIFVLLGFIAAGFYAFYKETFQWQLISSVERIIYLIGIFLTFLLLVFSIAIIYYPLKYRRSNIFLQNKKTKVFDISDNDIINIANKLTEKIFQIRREYLNKNIDHWHPSYLVLLYANLFRLAIERGQIKQFYNFMSNDNLKRTVFALKELNQDDLILKLNKALDKNRNEDNYIDPEEFMWYKLPLKIAIIEYIRKHIEDFGDVK